ncbi:MAG: tRNA pseudouridine(55) synthase TruB [Dehalococcoidia bacterium]|nr:tRNA pseudouridine(55) synthase TruB [Dehalococcoidia bacterium]
MNLRGFININKPKDLTSFDVVREIRKATNVKKVGHAGTLDPDATGVLPIAIGQATRLLPLLVDSPKRYRGIVRFGISTDTYDSSGTIITKKNASNLTRESVNQNLKDFHGEILQIPPAYSAIKKNGVRAYSIARKGGKVDLEPRKVRAIELVLRNFDNHNTQHPTAEIEVFCEKGFYIRSLAHDLGEKLGTGAHLEKLSRTQVGLFKLENSEDLYHAKKLLENGISDQIVENIDTVVTHWPAIIIGTSDAKRIYNGQDIILTNTKVFSQQFSNAKARCYGPNGELIALVKKDEITKSWHPYKVIKTD